MRKGDISINTIVYVAIAVFVLIIIIGFTTGAFQKLISPVSPSDIDGAKTQCDLLCDNAKSKVLEKGINEWESTDYCTKKFSIELEATGETKALNCWEAPISKTCQVSKQVTSGDVYTCKTMDLGGGLIGCKCEANAVATT